MISIFTIVGYVIRANLSLTKQAIKTASTKALHSTQDDKWAESKKALIPALLTKILTLSVSWAPL